MRAIAAVAVLLAGAAAAATGEVAERDLRMAIGYAQRGHAALQKGNVARAREEFDRAVSKFPTLPDAHAGFGHIAMRERRFEDALREYRLAEAGSKDLGALRLQLETERYARSRDELQRLQEIELQLTQEANRAQMQSETAASGGMTSGQTQRQIVEVEREIRALESIKQPTSASVEEAPAEVLFFQGNALFDLKRTGEAIAVWEVAARRLPDFGPVHNNLAVAYWMSGRMSDAWASLKRAEIAGFKVNPSFRADLAKASPTAELAAPSPESRR